MYNQPKGRVLSDKPLKVYSRVLKAEWLTFLFSWCLFSLLLFICKILYKFRPLVGLSVRFLHMSTGIQAGYKSSEEKWVTCLKCLHAAPILLLRIWEAGWQCSISPPMPPQRLCYCIHTSPWHGCTHWNGPVRPRLRMMTYLPFQSVRCDYILSLLCHRHTFSSWNNVKIWGKRFRFFSFIMSDIVW